LVSEEGGDEGGDAVAVEEAEDVCGVFEVVDDAVGVAVEGAAAVAWAGFGGGRGSLVGLYVVGTALACVSGEATINIPRNVLRRRSTPQA
jgi:hypothetical protein